MAAYKADEGSTFLHELRSTDAERCADPRDVVDRDIGFGPLDRSDESAMHTSSMSQLFLADPQLFALSAYPLSEHSSEVGWRGNWHVIMGRTMMCLRRQRIPSILRLAVFSPAMFGEGATAHIKIVDAEEARSLVDEHTRIVATRASHDRLARNQLPGAADETARYAMLKPGVGALHLHYRGPQVGDDGRLPVGGMVTFYLIEVEEYEQAEAA